MYVLFNGFIQPIDVIADITGISEHELLIDDGFDVYVEDPNCFTYGFIKMHIMTRLQYAYPARIFAPRNAWLFSTGQYPEHHSDSYNNVKALELPF
jgi:hypothetical protein